MFVMLFKSVHPIIAIHCDIRYIDTLKVVSIPVSLSCILQYGDASMYHPISSHNTFFQGRVKSMKMAKFIALENFQL